MGLTIGGGVGSLLMGMAIGAVVKPNIEQLQSNLKVMENELSKIQKINAQSSELYQFLLETKEILRIGKEANL